MSEIMKCPMCGSERERLPDYKIKRVAWTCCRCCFTCNNEDLPRISAAMELASDYATLEARYNVLREAVKEYLQADDDRCAAHKSGEPVSGDYVKSARAEVDRLLEEL